MDTAAPVEQQFLTNHDIITAAYKNLGADAWNYICGAAESETTMRRNRMSLDCLAFRPKVLVDVGDVDISTTFLGHKLEIPVMMAPMGGVQNYADGGALVPDDACEACGSINFVSTVTQPELEVTAANSPHPKVFQLYIRGDDDWIRTMVRRACDAGYAALALTVDSAYYGNRERLSREQLADRRPAAREFQKRLTWDSVKLIQDELAGTPLIIKGIMRPEDAARAVELGVECIYISNHGGRQLDHVQGSIDMLPGIVDAVNGKAEVIIDGGFTRGTDVVKAVALGARAVLIGKLQAWALGAGGLPALLRSLDILAWEIETALGLLGVTKLDELDPSFVAQGLPAMPPHEMSAFPHLPGGRIT
jgi:isopentenyl diphosphate isomerase/L-lactate dehydrogenase-like FMN-dependent dehydrogenase